MNTYEPGTTGAEFAYEDGDDGLVGTLAVRVNDGDGNIVIGPQTSGIIALGGGAYRVELTLPGTEGDWVLQWSRDGSFDPDTGAIEQFRTVSTPTEAPSVPPLIPISEDGAGQAGPCQAWSSVDAMVASGCCPIEGSDPDVLEDSIVAASQLLYPLSGSQFSGTCSRTVRPCSDDPVCYGPWGYWDGRSWAGRHRGCGCTPQDRIPLAGHARSIVEVVIDGEIVDADTYELREGMWLDRMRDPDDLDTALYWPRCQAMDKPLGSGGTFSITYEYGFDPPSSGILAVEELACALYRSCTSDDPADCALPQGIVRIERQGITIELDGFRAWGLTDGKWKTGMPMVDAFLNSVNPQNHRRIRAQVWSPDLWKYPRPVAQSGS